MRFTIDVERRLVTTVADGVLDYSAVAEHMNGLKAHPDFNPDFDQFADFSGVTEIKLSAEEIRLFAGRNVFSGRARRAAVAPNDLTFGVGRMYENYRRLFGGQEEARLFRNKSDALQWLLGDRNGA